MKQVHSRSAQAEVVLGALLSHGASLQSISLGSSSGAVQLIPVLHTLRHCTLSSTSISWEEDLDLGPLQALPNLEDLALANGCLKNLHAAAVHLTSLELECCSASCSQDCMCVTSLSQLNVNDTTLENFHNMGLVACCSLRSFACTFSDMTAGHTMQLEDLKFRDSNTSYQVPASLTVLTSLTALEFYLSEDGPEVLLDWLTCLPALRNLSAAVFCDSTVLPYCLTAMTNLRTLQVVADASCHGECKIKPMFDWKSLTALTSMRFSGCVRVTERFPLSDLASLTNLKVMDFGSCSRPDVSLLNQLAELAYKLGKDRPDVAFIPKVRHD